LDRTGQTQTRGKEAGRFISSYPSPSPQGTSGGRERWRAALWSCGSPGLVEWSVVECGVVWWRWILSHLWDNPSHLSDEPMVDTCREYRGLPGVSPSDRCSRTHAALGLGLYARASACSIPRSLPARECGLGARERESSREECGSGERRMEASAKKEK
jgi:hypothetical protein